MKPDCVHKNKFTNPKSYSNHRRACIGGFKHPWWKEEGVSYKELHSWVRRWLPKPELCNICKSRLPKEVANLDQKYSRNLNTWSWLCISCHRLMDFSRLREERGYAKTPHAT